MADAPRPRPLRATVGASLAAAALLLSACGGQEPGAATVVGGDDDGFHAAVLPQPYDVDPRPLTATDGSSFSLTRDTDAPLTLVFFGYTNCPDICQTIMASVASAMTRLDEADRERVGMVFVTTDPARDDEQTLRTYLDRFDPSFEGLTGDLDLITEIAASMSVPIEKGKKLPSGGYEVDHGTPVLGLTADDRVPLVWTAGTSSAQLAEDIHQELDQ